MEVTIHEPVRPLSQIERERERERERDGEGGSGRSSFLNASFLLTLGEAVGALKGASTPPHRM